MQPSLFISHGAPNVVIAPSAVRSAIMALSDEIEKPDAIVIASAHYETEILEVVSDETPETQYDFGGFDPSLYEMVYPAPGLPGLAREIGDAFEAAGLQFRMNAKRAYDHGIWTPLMLAFPDADIPVVQVSIQPNKDAAHHFAVGKALGELRDKNVLVIGSGHITHNLREVFTAMRGGDVSDQSRAKIDQFVSWIGDQLFAGDKDALLDWQAKAPYASHNHPTTEHFLPLFFAYGAGVANQNGGTKATLLHRSTQFEVFTSDIWRFD